MGKVTFIFRALLLDKKAIEELSTPIHQWRLLSILITLILGLAYGYTSITINSELIASFETPELRDTVVPALFLIFGIIMIIVTKVGFSLLLWAGSRGLKGPGRLALLYRNSTIALIPSIFALPGFISIQAGNPLTALMIFFIIISIAWIYLIMSKIIEVTQQFDKLRSYGAVAIALIFFISVYYITMPPPN